jgi:hypothetical protein
MPLPCLQDWGCELVFDDEDPPEQMAVAHSTATVAATAAMQRTTPGVLAGKRRLEQIEAEIIKAGTVSISVLHMCITYIWICTT